jgi:hypothetical protein
VRGSGFAVDQAISLYFRVNDALAVTSRLFLRGEVGSGRRPCCNGSPSGPRGTTSRNTLPADPSPLFALSKVRSRWSHLVKFDRIADLVHLQGVDPVAIAGMEP